MSVTFVTEEDLQNLEKPIHHVAGPKRTVVDGNGVSFGDDEAGDGVTISGNIDESGIPVLEARTNVDAQLARLAIGDATEETDAVNMRTMQNHISDAISENNAANEVTWIPNAQNVSPGKVLLVKAVGKNGFITAVEGGESPSGGITPHIGANGNWWIGEEDTGVSAGATDEQISGAVEEYLEENPLVKTVNGTAPDENGNVELDIQSGGGGGSSESGAFYFTVILEEDVSSVNLLFPVNWGRMIQFNIHADAMGNSLTADMALETEVGGSYANRGTLTPDFKALDYYGIRYMWNNGYTWFATGTNTATNSADLAVPTLGTWRPAPGNNTNNFKFISRTDGVLFPKGMRFDVWGVYAP